MPVYKEGLEAVIVPTIESLKKAITTYERQGGTVSILICEDGMQLWSDADAEVRKVSRTLGRGQLLHGLTHWPVFSYLLYLRLTTIETPSDGSPDPSTATTASSAKGGSRKVS
jgi:hypothetical protein